MDGHSNYHPPMGSSPSPATATATTFVQADAHTFRELVQRLTGADENASDKLPITLPARLAGRSSNSGSGGGDSVGPRRSTFKLQERRQSMRKLEIKLGLTSLRQTPPPNHVVVSPVPSPVTPLSSDSLFSVQLSVSGGSSPATLSEEEKAIAEKGFYLHPSPLSTPRGSEPPELLPLFPLSSPKQQQHQHQQQ